MNHALLLAIVLLGTGCDLAKRAQHKAAVLNKYELVALELAQQNRLLKSQINSLHSELQKIKNENAQLKLANSPEVKRDIASIRTAQTFEDLVKFDVYKWRPDQLLATARSSFKEKDYEKSAQFYKTFFTQYPQEKTISDQLIFEAGVAAFETNNHHDWALEFLERVVRDYPASKFYRKSKLWMGLTYLKTNQEKEFFKVAEEFKKKYRNTEEWKILSPHYDEIFKRQQKNR